MKFFLLLLLLLPLTFFSLAQNVGIGTTTPSARLHVKDSAVLFSATADIPGIPGLPAQQGAGRRMMWYPNKAAFRVGYVNGSQWDQNNIGNYSFAAGRTTLASGNSSVAFGYGTNAAGFAATAFGRETIAAADYATAGGFGSEANGYISTAIGAYSFATGDYSTAIGNTATASGISSLAIGENINAKAAYETVLGRWNTDYTPTGAATDRLFSIGNGTTAVAKSDAVTILKNGKIGIANSTPGFPLTFSGVLGDKISLWTDGTSTHYGFGIQSNLLQMFSKTSLDDIAFGYGSSSSFNEAMRIKGNGNVGIGVNPSARLSLSANGIELTGAAASNTFKTLAGTLGSAAGSELSLASIGFASTNNSSLGIRAYRTSTGTDWTTTALLLEHDVDNTARVNSTYLALGTNGNIGIGTTSPFSPLTLNNNLGQKISLYGNASNNYGIGVQAGTFQIHSDAPGADIAFGYGSSGSFTETIRIKGNGALAVNGNAGSAGQVLQSNGSGAAPTWVGASNTLYNNTSMIAGTGGITLSASDPATLLPGLSYTYNSTSNGSKLLMSFNIRANTLFCTSCGSSRIELSFRQNNFTLFTETWDLSNFAIEYLSGSYLFLTGNGTNTIEIFGKCNSGPAIFLGSSVSPNSMIVQVIPLQL